MSLSRKEKHLPDPQLQETTALEPVVDGQRVRAPEEPLGDWGKHWAAKLGDCLSPAT